MNTLPALSVANVAVRQHDGLYSLNDLHKASGGAAKHKPVLFLRLDQTKALIDEISKGTDLYLSTKAGTKGGTFACKELVIAYAAWISPAFHLQVIRVFLDSVTPQPQPQPQLPLYPKRTSADNIFIPAGVRRDINRRAQDLLQSAFEPVRDHLLHTVRSTCVQGAALTLNLQAAQATLAAATLDSIFAPPETGVLAEQQACLDPSEPAATLDAVTLYRVALICRQVQHLQQHLAGLDSPLAGQIHEYLQLATTNAKSLQRDIGDLLNSARRHIHTGLGLSPGDTQ